MSNTKAGHLTWVEINKANLAANTRLFRTLIGTKVRLGISVKANAYGHGLIETSKISLLYGADWLCINALFEAEKLRKAGIKAPLYIMGYTMKSQLPEALKLGCRMVVYNRETVQLLSIAAKKLNTKARIHIKVETGNHRQGVGMNEVVDFVKFAKKSPNIEIEGIATHFANIEDISAGEIELFAQQKKSGQGFSIGSYPAFQLENFKRIISELENAGIYIPIKHCANSAATLLFPQTHFEMVRPGIAVYGLWPSESIKIAASHVDRAIKLLPVLSWKTRIAQIKNIPAGAYIGYGCTHRTKRKTRLAILPVGYYDGYDRGFSDKGYVLIHGKRAHIRGRVCMNITMVDVTNIPQARVEDTVTLLGRDGREEITAEFLAELANTINYEITTRINEGIVRIITS